MNPRAIDASATVDDFTSLPFKELDRYLRTRAAAGDPLQVPRDDAPVREAGTDGADPADVSVRESVSVSDVPGLMGNYMYRRVDTWFKQYDGAWTTYAHQEQMVDYKDHIIIVPSELEDALEIRQEKDYLDSGLIDKTISVRLKKWGRQFSVPYAVVENDDKNFFAAMPGRMTRSAERTMQKIIVRNTLEANPNAYDGVALFSASRGNALFGGLSGNLVSGAGSALSSANVQAGLAAVNSFTGDADLNPSNVPLNIPAKYLVVPPSLALQAAQLINSTILIAAGTANPITTQGNLNPLRQTILQDVLQVVVDRYLTNATAWYLLPEKDAGPLAVCVRQGRGLRPRLMKNIPMRQSIGGGDADTYMTLVDDLHYLWNFDLSAAAYKPFSSLKFAGA